MTMPIRPLRQDVHAVVLVPSRERWQSLRQAYEDLRPGVALGREYLSRSFGRRRVVLVHTGHEAVEAAVSAQYAVDRWNPHVLACDGGNEAFDHVAMRNGMKLAAVEELELRDSDNQIVTDANEIAGNDPTPEEAG
jgi:hypothetical protein